MKISPKLTGMDIYRNQELEKYNLLINVLIRIILDYFYDYR